MIKREVKSLKLQNLDKEGLDKFLGVVDRCEGTVNLIVKDQFDLNLKSKLSQYMALVGLFSRAEVPEIEIKCSNKADISRLIEFMVADGGLY